MEEKSIKIYHTHTEISPYELGENIKLENSLSVWIDAEYRYDPLGFFINENTLYLPRGANIDMLEDIFNSTSFIIHKPNDISTIPRKYTSNTEPRDDIQKNAIDFLCCRNDYSKYLGFSQHALVLDTGIGKTFITIKSIIEQHERAIIITPKQSLKEQWIKSFSQYTNLPDDMLIDVSGSKTIEKIMNGKCEGFIYFINHQTIQSYAKSTSWNDVKAFFDYIECGIKVFDEAHLMFHNVLMVDFFSNTRKTYYLTANFERTDTSENRLFTKCFNSSVKFGKHDTDKLEETRKHIHYIPVMYRSSPTMIDYKNSMTYYGFSVMGFSKYALHDDLENTQMRAFYRIFDMASRLDGKILVTVPRIEDTEFVKESILKEYNGIEKTISTINSNNSNEQNLLARDADVIVSTIKSCGTGVDIRGLRCIINLEPFSSNITCNQLAGRLREYAPDKDTYFFDLIDMAFDPCIRQEKNKRKYLKTKCKAIEPMMI